MENCSLTIWIGPTAFAWARDSAKGFFITCISDSANPDRSLPRRIRRPSSDIKKLRRLAHDPGLDLWSLDECHFQQHGTRAVMWVPPENSDPVLLHAPTRKSVALFGAVNLRHGQLVTQQQPTFGARTFRQFLGKLLPHWARDRRMVLILDNARYHHARSLRPFLHARRGWVRLDFLPPYSPALNPIERVWKLTRKLATHNEYFPKLENLTAAVSAQMEAWKKPNAALRKLCCIT
jgi:transposase